MARMQAADVYAFGVLLWEMAAGQRMFAGMPWAQVMAAITLRHTRPRLPQGRAMPSGLESVLRMCLLTSPADRPGFSEVQSRYRLYTAPCTSLLTHRLHAKPSALGPHHGLAARRVAPCHVEALCTTGSHTLRVDAKADQRLKAVITTLQPHSSAEYGVSA